MTIQVGDRVVAATYKDEGPGRVLELEDLFDQTFATIFFPSNKQVKLPVEDLDPIRSPFEKLQETTRGTLESETATRPRPSSPPKPKPHPSSLSTN